MSDEATASSPGDRPASSAGPRSPKPTIVRLDSARREEGIRALLGGDRTAAERFLSFAEQTKLRLDGLWAVIGRDGRPSLAVLAAPSAGRTATLFATAARSIADADAIAALVNVAHAGLATFDVDLAQALVDPRDVLQLEAFDRSGMSRLATLSYLEKPLQRHATTTVTAWPDDVRPETWDPTNRAELIATLERTYVNTLDCPALAGLRRGEDVLEGHLHSGRFERGLWTMLRFVQRPRGASDASSVAGLCLLNGAHAVAGAAASVELVYLGLVPEARGRGLGRLLLEHGLSLLRDRTERSVVLAVDERNEPAARLYRDAGFRFSLRRVAFIRAISRAVPRSP